MLKKIINWFKQLVNQKSAEQRADEIVKKIDPKLQHINVKSFLEI